MLEALADLDIVLPKLDVSFGTDKISLWVPRSFDDVQLNDEAFSIDYCECLTCDWFGSTARTVEP